MGDTALLKLWATLRPEYVYEKADLPSLTDPADVTGKAEAFLWDELLERTREDGLLLSFFIVDETIGNCSGSVFVSPDWPSAEGFANV